VITSSEEITLVALIVIALRLSEGISKSVSQSVKNSTKCDLKKKIHSNLMGLI